MISKAKLSQIISNFDEKAILKQSIDPGFKKRIESFRIYTWFGKHPLISMIECAKRGWFNTADNTLECSDCPAKVTVTEEDPRVEPEIDLIKLHSEECYWRKMFVDLSNFNHMVINTVVPSQIPIPIAEQDEMTPEQLLDVYKWELIDGGVRCPACFRICLFEHLTIFDPRNEHRFWCAVRNRLKE
jgi:hypothetical protein